MVVLRALVPAVAAFVSVVGSAAGPATSYTATLVRGLPGGTTTEVTGINASGAVVGWTHSPGPTPFGTNTAFVFDEGILTLVPNGFGFQPHAINDSGQLAGDAYVASRFPSAYRYSGGVMVNLNPYGDSQSRASAINAAGDVVGYFSRGGLSHNRAFANIQGVVVDLGTLGGFRSTAVGINTFGEIAGSSELRIDAYHAFRWARGTTQDLGTLGGESSFAFGINASGDVVGHSTTAGNRGPHAFLHTGGRMQDLGTLGGDTSTARAINAAGVVVGTATNAAGAARAFVYAGDAMLDLTSQVTAGLNDGVVLTDAVAINDAGQIVATTCPGTFLPACWGYRLDPVPVIEVRAIEYYHEGHDLYLVATILEEIAELDDGTLGGWTRTGASFRVKSGPQAGTSPVCRFLSTSFDPKISHFHTPYADECALVKRNADWLFKGVSFYAASPGLSGACPPGTLTVYRLYNDGRSGAPNHRYTTSPETRARMIAQGWIVDGHGPEGIAMCADG